MAGVLLQLGTYGGLALAGFGAAVVATGVRVVMNRRRGKEIEGNGLDCEVYAYIINVSTFAPEKLMEGVPVYLSRSQLEKLKAQQGGFHVARDGFTEEPLLVVAVMGSFNAGKSFLLARLTGKYLGESYVLNTLGLSLCVAARPQYKKVLFMDSAGKSTAAAVSVNNTTAEGAAPRLPPAEAARAAAFDRRAVDAFTREFVAENSDVLIYVMDRITLENQITLDALAADRTTRRQVVCVHNLINAKKQERLTTLVQEDMVGKLPDLEGPLCPDVPVYSSHGGRVLHYFVGYEDPSTKRSFPFKWTDNKGTHSEDYNQLVFRRLADFLEQFTLTAIEEGRNYIEFVRAKLQRDFCRYIEAIGRPDYTPEFYIDRVGTEGGHTVDSPMWMIRLRPQEGVQFQMRRGVKFPDEGRAVDLVPSLMLEESDDRFTLRVDQPAGGTCAVRLSATDRKSVTVTVTRRVVPINDVAGNGSGATEGEEEEELIDTLIDCMQVGEYTEVLALREPVSECISRTDDPHAAQRVYELIKIPAGAKLASGGRGRDAAASSSSGGGVTKIFPTL